jgi:UDP-N-acetylglucosamine acyltransferase
LNGDPETKIDPTAVIRTGAQLGAGIVVGPYCVIGDRVRIGDRCRLDSHVVVEGPTVIGPDNRIAPMAYVGGPPQDRKYGGEPTALEIGAGNNIREYVTLNRGTVDGGGVTRVGNDNLLMAYTHIAHDCRIGDHTEFGNAATLAGHVEVGDHANVGAFSGVHQFCRIADHAFIGGYSVITQDVLPWVMTVGNRATTHGINLIGLRRVGYPAETIRAIKKCYMTLFRSGMILEKAMEAVEKELGAVEEVRYFLEFVRGSKRGICR